MGGILVASPVRRKPRILAEFLRGLEHLDPCGERVDFLFVDDHDETEAESSALLRGWRPPFGRYDVGVPQGMPRQRYDSADDWHRWDAALASRVAVLRNHLLGHALQAGYDHILLVDSDLVLASDTLRWLLESGRDIISEVFWTEFFRAEGQPTGRHAPNCWLWGECGLFPVKPEDDPNMDRREALRRQEAWFRELRTPGVYEVGGLGACTLISRKVLEAGVDYRPIHNLGWWGEDRFFCVRAAVAGFRLWVDTNCPPLHLYRTSMLPQVGPWRARTARRLAGEVTGRVV